MDFRERVDSSVWPTTTFAANVVIFGDDVEIVVSCVDISGIRFQNFDSDFIHNNS